MNIGGSSGSDYHVDFLRSYNVGCTKRVGLFPNRKTTLENAKKQRALNGSLKPCSFESKKKVSFWLSKHVVLSQPQLGNSRDVDPKHLLYLTFISTSDPTHHVSFVSLPL